MKDTMKHTVSFIAIMVCCAFLNASGTYGKNTEECLRENYEKIVVHTNKKVYVTGEILRHKVYITRDARGKWEHKSRVVYFEIANHSHTVCQWRLNVTNGANYGAISIPDTIQTGLYRLRAYTNWQRNVDQGYLFQSPVYIVQVKNPVEPGTKSHAFNDLPPAVTVRPTGGKLLAGQVNTVGIYSPFPRCAFTVSDLDSNEIIRSRTDNNGYGHFDIHAEANRQYTCTLEVPGGNQTIRLPLPAAPEARVMIMPDDKSVRFSFKHFANRPQVKSYKLDIEKNGYVIHSLEFIPSKGEETKKIPIRDIGTGLFYASLITPAGQTIYNQLFHVPQTTSHDKVHAALDKTVYKKRDRGKLSVETLNLAPGEQANISVSIAEKAPSHEMPGSYPYAIKYMAAELKYYSQALPQYLRNDQTTFFQTMPPGFYVWKDPNVMAGNSHILEDFGFALQGRVTNKQTRSPCKNMTIGLFVRGHQSCFTYATTDENGVFYFSLDTSYDNKALLFQSISEKVDHSDISWEISGKNLANQHEQNTREIHLPAEYLEYSRKLHLTRRIFNKDNKNHENARDTSIHTNKMMNFKFRPDYVIYPEEYVELLDFLEISKNILPAVRYKYNKKDKTTTIKVNDPENGLQYDENATVFIDGVMINDLSQIRRLGTKEIKKIEVTHTRVYYGNLTFHGILSIYTHHPEKFDAYFSRKNHFYLNSVPTANNQHDKPATVDQPVTVPDFRQSLIWEPQILLGKGQKKEISFTVPDLGNTFEVIINGITNRGNRVARLLEFKVK